MRKEDRIMKEILGSDARRTETIQTSFKISTENEIIVRQLNERE
jgi:hypothetical protein